MCHKKKQQEKENKTRSRGIKRGRERESSNLEDCGRTEIV